MSTPPDEVKSNVITFQIPGRKKLEITVLDPLDGVDYHDFFVDDPYPEKPIGHFNWQDFLISTVAALLGSAFGAGSIIFVYCLINLP